MLREDEIKRLINEVLFKRGLINKDIYEKCGKPHITSLPHDLRTNDVDKLNQRLQSIYSKYSDSWDEVKDLDKTINRWSEEADRSLNFMSKRCRNIRKQINDTLNILKDNDDEVYNGLKKDILPKFKRTILDLEKEFRSIKNGESETLKSIEKLDDFEKYNDMLILAVKDVSDGEILRLIDDIHMKGLMFKMHYIQDDLNSEYTYSYIAYLNKKKEAMALKDKEEKKLDDYAQEFERVVNHLKDLGVEEDYYGRYDNAKEYLDGTQFTYRPYDPGDDAYYD